VIRPTQLRMLLALFALAGAVGWALGVLVLGQLGRVVPVPPLAPMTVWLVAIALAVWAALSRPRLLRKPNHRPMPALVAARSAALALAASRAGAVVGGFYLGLAIATIPQFTTPSGSATVWAAFAASLGSAALVAAALWLERLCRIRDQDDDPSAPSHA
jgi:MFS superfamily sulfate permease-like transporter